MIRFRKIRPLAGLALLLWGASILPARAQTLKFLSSEALNNVVVLQWDVADVPPGAVFIVERSKDGTKWQACGTVPARESRRKGVNYQYSNTIKKAFRYYRLRIKAKGSVRLLGTTFVDLNCAEVFFTARAEPRRDKVKLHYRLDSDRRLILRVYDQIGQEIRTQLVPSGEAGVYDVSVGFGDFRPGVYLLVLTQEDLDLDLADARIEY